nr:hypothetical protein [uncultured Vibrio sp.]
MTTLLKSNNIATNTLGHISGFKGPRDFVGFLDFNRDEYLTNTNGEVTKYTFEESVTCSRNGVANVFDDEFNITEVAANTPRRSYNPYLKRYGLCGEAAAKNMVSSPETPLSQVVNVDAGAASESLFLTVYGTGSATITATELTAVDGKSAATQGVAAEFSRSTSSAFTAQLTITGDVKFVQFEAKTTASTPISGTRQQEVVELTEVFRDLIASNSEYTIVVSAHAFYDVPGNNRGSLSVEFDNGTGLGVVLSENKHTTTTDALREVIGGTPTTLVSIVGRGSGGNYTITRRESDDMIGMTAIRDAAKTTANLLSNAIAKILPMGGLPQTGTGAQAFGGSCSYIAIYERAMTDQELADCAQGLLVY